MSQFDREQPAIDVHGSWGLEFMHESRGRSPQFSDHRADIKRVCMSPPASIKLSDYAGRLSFCGSWRSSASMRRLYNHRPAEFDRSGSANLPDGMSPRQSIITSFFAALVLVACR